MIIVVLLFVAILIAVALRLHFAPNYRLMLQFDGPPRLPVVGNLRDLQFCDSNDIYKTLRRWEATYGTMWALKYGSAYSIFTERAEQMEVILKNSVNIQKSRDYRFIEPWLGEGLLISSGAKWHLRRKQLTPAFHYQILKDFIPVFNEQALVFVKILQEKSQNGDPIDVAPLLCSLTLDVICETAMGIQLNSQRQQSPYAEARSEFINIAMYRSFRPWLWPEWVFSRLPIGQRSNKAIRVMHDFTNRVIGERDEILRNRVAPGDEGTEAKNSSELGFEWGQKQKHRMAFLDLLLKLKAEGGMDQSAIREEVDTFMFEGHDTTATSLMWVLYLIAVYPEVQKRLQEDVDSLFDTLSESEPNFVYSEPLSNLTYLDAVFKESQRLFPAVPVIGRTITKAFEVDGYRIPAGVTLNLSLLGLHRNPEHYPDPEIFDPTRFEPENSEKRHPFAFLPFSAGPRNCIGQKFALLEEKIIICHVLRRFNLEAVEPMSSMRPSMQLVLKPLNGIWLRITPRTETE